jgi:hypothetical protein
MRFFVILFFFAYLPAYSQTPYYANWAQATGGTGFDQAASLACDSSDHIYTLGMFRAPFDVDAGPNTYMLTPFNDGYDDIFISKHDKSGSLEWAFKLGYSEGDYAKTIVNDDSANLYLTGAFKSNLECDPSSSSYWLNAFNYGIFIIKYDSASNLKWAKSISGGQVDYGRDIALDDSNNVFITGAFGTPSNNSPGYTVDFNPGVDTCLLTANGQTDIFIAKFTSDGTFQWARQFGDLGSDCGYNICSDDSGNCYVRGIFCGTVDFDPDPSQVHNITGHPTIPSDFVLKLDRNGNLVWVFSLSIASSSTVAPSDVGHRFMVTNAGELYLPIAIAGSQDLNPLGSPYIQNAVNSGFLLKYTTNGQLSFVKELCQSPYSVGVRSMKIGLNNNLLICGSANLPADLDPGPGSFIIPWRSNEDSYWTEFDTSGNFITAKWAGSHTNDAYNDIIQTHNGSIYTCGYHGAYSGPSNTFMYYGDNVDSTTTAGAFDCTFVKYGRDSLTIINPIICAGDTFFTTMANYTTPGHYIETYLNSLGYDSTVMVNLQNQSISYNTSVSNSTITITSSNATFEWYDCTTQQLIPNEFSNSYTASTSGSYAAILTVNGCSDTTSCIPIVLTEISTNASTDNNFTVSYNFIGDQIMINGNANNPLMLVKLYTANGQLVKTELNNLSLPLLIDCADLSSGIYFAELRTQDKCFFSKLVLSK